MSEENVELVREWVEAWNRRDIDAMLSGFDRSVEWHTSGTFPDLDPVYEGHAGFARFQREAMGAWESFVITTHEVRDCGDQVLILGAFEGTARDGLEVRRQTASLWTFREGVAVRVQIYAGWSQALEAAGLSE
jgi:ketosteroid isomerase-like protein